MSRSPKTTVLSLVRIMRSTNWGPRCFSTQRYCEGYRSVSRARRASEFRAREEIRVSVGGVCSP